MDGEIHEVKRTEPNQFTRTFFRVNRIKVANVANSLERTDNDTYRSDREMSVCQMEQEVAAERRSADRARATGRASALADLRRLAGLALDSARRAGFDPDPLAAAAGGRSTPPPRRPPARRAARPTRRPPAPPP